MATPTYTQIRTEIDTDPKSLGLVAMKAATNAAEQIAAKLNERGASAETLTPTWTETKEVLAVLVGTEVIALTQANRDLLTILTAISPMKTGSSTLRTAVAAIFAGGTTSRANLVALTTRAASRAEALWGEGMVVSDTHVGNALAL